MDLIVSADSSGDTFKNMGRLKLFNLASFSIFKIRFFILSKSCRSLRPGVLGEDIFTVM